MTQSSNMPPNILFFLIDDMGWTDLTCTGSDFYETPRLDELRRDGLLFSDAYAAAPVCSPTRASILSGKYPARVGITQYIGGHGVGKLCDVPYFTQLPRSEFSLASALRAGGYQTWHVGKWHLGEGRSAPTHHGFDVSVGGGRWGAPPQGYFAPWGLPDLEGEDGDYLTDALTDAALGLLQSRDAGRPFFLNFWHYAVHTPIQAPAALVEKYERKARALGLDQKDPFEEGEHFSVDHKRDQRVLRRKFQSDPTYAAMVENLDGNVGRVLDALDELGLRDNTLVVFTSDNGGLSTAEGSPTSNAPLSQGKGWMYEGGNREPLLMRWPGQIAPGTSCETPVTSPDFYPTFLQAAGLPLLPHQHCDGESLLPLMRGDQLEREAIFWHYPHYSNQGDTPSCAVRAGRWKLIEWFETGQVELYDLRGDIAESHDLSAREPERVAALRGQLATWKRQVEALIPKNNLNNKDKG